MATGNDRDQPRERWVSSWELPLRQWAHSVGLDPDHAVYIEKVLNPLGAEWKDWANMRRRVYEFITNKKLN
jgi:hypothetical protein